MGWFLPKWCFLSGVIAFYFSGFTDILPGFTYLLWDSFTLNRIIVSSNKGYKVTKGAVSDFEIF